MKKETSLIVPESGWKEAQYVLAKRRNLAQTEFEEFQQFFSTVKTMNSTLLDERLDTLRGTVEAVLEMARYRKLLDKEVVVLFNGRSGNLGNQNIYFEV